MDAEKDYYSILGVLPSIDDVALTAVYRALLKKYHPDVFKGSKTEADRRTKEINEAYEVLGDAHNRRAYDNARKGRGFGNYQQEEPTSSPNDVTADWELVKKYHPEAEVRRVDLSRLSQSLAFTFQITVLENKLASDTDKVATLAANMESEFLGRYFGKNWDIQRFARKAVLHGRSDVAKEVNRAIKVLGTPPDKDVAHRFIRDVENSMDYDPRKCDFDATMAIKPAEHVTFFTILFLVVFGVFALVLLIAGVFGTH